MHKERFRDIVVQFVSRLDERFDAIEAALERGDLQQLADLGHSLKGASGNCGFMRLAETAAKLEASSRAADLDSIPGILREFRELHARIEVPAQPLHTTELAGTTGSRLAMLTNASHHHVPTMGSIPT